MRSQRNRPPLTLDTRVKTIQANCAALDVKVHTYCRAFNRYIRFTADDRTKWSQWETRWHGFVTFAILQIKPFYPNAQITKQNRTSVTFCIGSLFDFISEASGGLQKRTFFLPLLTGNNMSNDPETDKLWLTSNQNDATIT